MRKSGMEETARSFLALRMTDRRKRTGPPSPRLRRTGKAFWREKLAANQARDELVTRTLRRQGWSVIRIWEHSLRKPGGVLGRIERALGRRNNS